MSSAYPAVTRPNAGGEDLSGAIGIDFGTTNSVVAQTGDTDKPGSAELTDFAFPGGQTGQVFRSALCFWQGENMRGALEHAAGPWAISEFLDFPQGSRFIQSFKSVAANPAFESANLFEKRLRFEDMGQIFLNHLKQCGGKALSDLTPCRDAPVIVGRPVRYVGNRPDTALARQRYDAMFAILGRNVRYVYEPLGAAFSFAQRLHRPATLLVADFGGGTSDFSVVRIEQPDAQRRCTPLGSAGVGIAGDRFDYRIMDHLVLPLLGKGGTYRSFDKLLEIPAGHFADFADWSRLAMMRNRRTMEELSRLHRAASDPAAIARMMAVVEQELGHGLYEAVGRLKRMLSQDDVATFRFAEGGLELEAQVRRDQFESWIADDLARIDAAVDEALERAGLDAGDIDHVFLTGGSSLIPAVRSLFDVRFGTARIATGEELTSIAHGLALIGQTGDIDQWAAQDG